MNIISDRPVMVFKNENKYSVGLSNKLKDGSYDNGFFPIQFNKDVTLEDKTKIMIKNAWLSFYSWEFNGKKGKTYFIKCSDFTIAEEEKQANDPYQEIHQDIQLTDDDLPF